MGNFGNRIESIKGTSSECTITFDNGRSLKCYGEITVYGFCIYRDCLRMSDEDVEELRRLIEKKAAEKERTMVIKID